MKIHLTLKSFLNESLSKKDYSEIFDDVTSTTDMYDDDSIHNTNKVKSKSFNDGYFVEVIEINDAMGSLNLISYDISDDIRDAIYNTFVKFLNKMTNEYLVLHNDIEEDEVDSFKEDALSYTKQYIDGIDDKTIWSDIYEVFSKVANFDDEHILNIYSKENGIVYTPKFDEFIYNDNV